MIVMNIIWSPKTTKVPMERFVITEDLQLLSNLQP